MNNKVCGLTLSNSVAAILAVLASLLLALPKISSAQTVELCGSLDNAYGPFDYTNGQHRRDKLPIVEAGHFNADVENLVQGMTGPVYGDLEYTLRAFPNHSRALWSLARLHLREKTNKLDGGQFSIDCWFDRAIRMNRSDPAIPYVYGMYLHRAGKTSGALDQYLESLSLDDSNAEVHYNIGLLYLSMDRLELAAEHAKRAYSMGFPLQGLKRKLRDKGVDIS